METILIIGAFPVFSLLAHLFGAESRPGFLDLRRKPTRWI
jgi:hypothetical protein